MTDAVIISARVTILLVLLFFWSMTAFLFAGWRFLASEGDESSARWLRVTVALLSYLVPTTFLAVIITFALEAFA